MNTTAIILTLSILLVGSLFGHFVCWAEGSDQRQKEKDEAAIRELSRLLGLLDGERYSRCQDKESFLRALRKKLIPEDEAPAQPTSIAGEDILAGALIVHNKDNGLVYTYRGDKK